MSNPLIDKVKKLGDNINYIEIRKGDEFELDHILSKVCESLKCDDLTCDCCPLGDGETLLKTLNKSMNE